ncbi:MAG TPA: alpha/beta hydrolase, partial [Acidimicrobiia bacterium]|nr:alpha/beta hydrolase [Acidimicrobiia bacterium]
MPLDPEIRKLLDDLASVVGELDEQTPAEARALADEGMVALSGPGDASVTTADRRVPGPGGEIPIRVYTPSGSGVRPLVVFFHGGGFVIGSIRSHDGVCRDLAAATGAVLVSVEYRLAPEHR